MPFVILPVEDRWGIYKIHPNGVLTLAGQPNYKTEHTAKNTAMRWMRYRGEHPVPKRNSLGELVILD